MRVKRTFAGLTSVAAAAVGVIVTVQGPALADDAAPAVWRSYGNTAPPASAWNCGASDSFDSGAVAQACIVVTADHRWAQGAVIVRNNRDSLYGAEVAMITEGETASSTVVDERWACPNSGIAAHTWSVCFTSTFSLDYLSAVRVYAPGVNGQSIGNSKWFYL
jgi:hypothetical protein